MGQVTQLFAPVEEASKDLTVPVHGVFGFHGRISEDTYLIVIHSTHAIPRCFLVFVYQLQTFFRPIEMVQPGHLRSFSVQFRQSAPFITSSPPCVFLCLIERKLLGLHEVDTLALRVVHVYGEFFYLEAL